MHILTKAFYVIYFIVEKANSLTGTKRQTPLEIAGGVTLELEISNGANHLEGWDAKPQIPGS